MTTAGQRQTTAGLRARLDERREDPAMLGLSGELYAAADLIGSESILRSALADSGQPLGARGGMVRSLFEGRLSPLAVDVLVDVASQRWTGPVAMIEAIEELAAQAGFVVAERESSLDAVTDDLFGFAQVVGSSAELQLALTDPSVGPQAKAALVASLLEGRAAPATVAVLGHSLSHLRGRRADSVLDDLVALAAEQQHRSVAEVRVARPLVADQAQRLSAALTLRFGREIRLNVAVDPQVIGGIAVRVGGEVIDATMSTRIEQARRALVG